MAKHKRIFQHLLFGLGLLFFAGYMTHAAVTAQNVTQGYQTDQTLQKGMIVRLKPSDTSKIEALTQADGSDMLGVIVSSGDAPVSLSNAGVESEVFVATYGRYEVLLSTQNGPIKSGDLIAVSSLGGVGMKADNTHELVVGKALQNFDGKGSTESQTVLDTSNGKRTVSLGRAPVEISISRNPLYQKDSQPGVPQFLSRLVAVVTDQQISAFRIYASVGILMVSLIITGVMLFAGVRNGMVATGRNPLAKRSIAKNMIQVTLMSLIVFVIGVIAVYLLLRV
jgi:hypothetical protein